MISVFSAANSFEIKPESLYLYERGDSAYVRGILTTVAGGTYTILGILVGQGYPTWASSDTTVAKVGEFGLVTAADEGETSITAEYTSPEGKSFADTMTVVVAHVARILILPSGTIRLEQVGDTARVAVTAYRANNTRIGKVYPTWSIQDSTIASVSKEGLVTALGFGSTTLHATVGPAQAVTSVIVRRPAAPPPTSPTRDLLPPTPDGPGLFRGRGPWFEGDRLVYNHARRDLEGTDTLTYTLTYNSGGITDQFTGSGLATTTDTTISGTVVVSDGQIAQLAFQINDDKIIDLPRDTVTLSVSYGEHTDTDRVLIWEGICDRAVPIQNAIVSWLTYGAAGQAARNLLNPDRSNCQAVDENALASVRLLRVIDIPVLKEALGIEPESGNSATSLSALTSLDLTKPDMQGLSGVLSATFLAFDMTDSEWDQSLFDGMRVIESLLFNGVVYGELPGNTFTGVNPGQLGSSDPQCPAVTRYERRCKLTELQFFTNSRIATEDMTALENPTRALFTPVAASLQNLYMSGVFAADGSAATIPDELFSDLTSLEVLALHENGLLTLPIAVDFTVLTNLEELYLGDNELSVFPWGGSNGGNGGSVSRPDVITDAVWADYPTTDPSYKGILTSAPSSPSEGDFYFVANANISTGADLYVYKSGAWVKESLFANLFYAFLLCYTSENPPSVLMGDLCIPNTIGLFGSYADDEAAEAALWPQLAGYADLIELGAKMAYFNTATDPPTLREVTLTFVQEDAGGVLASARTTVSETLEVLVITDNNLRSVPVSVFTSFPNLEVLNVARNFLEGLPNGFFANVPEGFRNIDVSDNEAPVNFQPTVELPESDSTFTISMPLGAPKDLLIQTYIHGGTVQDSEGNTVTSLVLPRGGTAWTYKIIPTGERVQIRFQYLGATFLVGLFVASIGVDYAVVDLGGAGLPITLPKQIKELFNRVDLDLGLDLTAEQSELQLDLTHYFEGAGQPDLELRFGVRSSDTLKVKATLDVGKLMVRPLAVGTATVTVQATTTVTENGDVETLAYLRHSISVTVHAADTTAYNIRLMDLDNSYNAETRGALEEAAELFSDLLIDRQDRALVPSRIYECGVHDTEGILQLPVDDQVVLIKVTPQDGPLNQLASALSCMFSNQDSLPVLSDILFDEDDLLGDHLSDAMKISTIEHEMFHTLGLGAATGSADVERYSKLVEDLYTDSTRFTGTDATAGFGRAMNNKSYPFASQGIVPLESNGFHWHENIMGDELMTPLVDGDSSPRSEITILALQDMGYTLKSDWADSAESYTLPYARMAGAVAEDEDEVIIDLSGDLRKGPVWFVDENGRVTRGR